MPGDKDTKEIKKVEEVIEPVTSLTTDADKNTDDAQEASNGTSDKEIKAEGGPTRSGQYEKPRNPRPKNRRKPRRRNERERSEYEQRIIGIRRVARVVSGGRRFSFSVAVVVGDRKGKVGVGTGKSTDTSLAIQKAVSRAQKNIIELKLTEGNSIPHDLSAKYNASRVEIRPALGRGLVAGSSVRDVLELAGITDVSSKLRSRSKNKINNARVAIKALGAIVK